MKTRLLMACFVITWSSGFVGATLGAESASAPTLLAWRYLVAILLLTGGLLLPGCRQAVSRLTMKDVVRAIVTGLLSQGVFLGGVFAAASAGLNAGVSALMCSLQPMVVAVGARFFFGETLGKRTVLSLLVGFAGVALCVGPSGGQGIGSAWLVVISLLALSGAALIEKAWPTRTNITVDLWLQTLAATVVFIAWALIAGGLQVRMTASLAEALVWLVILSGFGGYASFTACLRRVGPVKTSVLLYLTPAVTLGWSWMMFGQLPTVLQLLGCAVILGGVLTTKV